MLKMLMVFLFQLLFLKIHHLQKYRSKLLTYI